MSRPKPPHRNAKGSEQFFFFKVFFFFGVKFEVSASFASDKLSLFHADVKKEFLWFCCFGEHCAFSVLFPPDSLIARFHCRAVKASYTFNSLLLHTPAAFSENKHKMCPIE